MKETLEYKGGENFDLRKVLMRGRSYNLKNRTEFFQHFAQELKSKGQYVHCRKILSPADRKVIVEDSTGKIREMLMFGSNNYLGFANNPLIFEKSVKRMKKSGLGIGGPPLLNGYTSMHSELEERLADLKKCESAMIFSSGYAANVGLVSGLVGKNDTVIYDSYSHASFCDGLNLAAARGIRFAHNDIKALQRKLEVVNKSRDELTNDIFVGVEGVYSMDGDLAPLDKIIPICKNNNAFVMLDDAHGTGVMGEKGLGTAEYFGMENEIDITMGTFSKTFAMAGGFVAASEAIVNYLRYFAKSYMFSASLPPSVVAAVLSGLDVLESNDSPISKLKENIRYADRKFKEFGLDFKVNSAIIPLVVPEGGDLREAAKTFEKMGIFLNSIEYPAVPISQQRFRASLMSIHTKEDIDRLAEAVAFVWSDFETSKLEFTEVA